RLFDIEFDVNDVAYASLVSWALRSPRATALLRDWTAHLSTRAQRALASVPFAVSACSLLFFGESLNEVPPLHLGPAVLLAGATLAIVYVGSLLRFSSSGLAASGPSSGPTT